MRQEETMEMNCGEAIVRVAEMRIITGGVICWIGNGTLGKRKNYMGRQWTFWTPFAFIESAVVLKFCLLVVDE